jgi:hypothetical protein
MMVISQMKDPFRSPASNFKSKAIQRFDTDMDKLFYSNLNRLACRVSMTSALLGGRSTRTDATIQVS